MGKLQGNRRSAARQHRPRRSAAKTRAPGPTPDPSLGFPTIRLEELARQQGVKPMTDLNEFGSLWPAEFDPDEFAAWLFAERAARRRLAAQTKRGSA